MRGSFVGTGTGTAPDERLFAVLVTETTGASEEVVYETFVKPLGVEEDYLGAGIIFVTKEQLRELVCPEGLALVLSPAQRDLPGIRAVPKGENEYEKGEMDL